MAKSIERSSWTNGYREARKVGFEPWVTDAAAHYRPPPLLETLTSAVHNDLGLNVLRTWPTLFDGTNTPHELPKWWKPTADVDVLICGGKKLPRGLSHAFADLDAT